MKVSILGVFDRGIQAANAIVAIRRDRLGNVVAYGPVAHHAIDQALRTDISPVRLFTLIGGILGCVSGFALPIYTVLDWPLITGGKPLISIPPFVVIAFELTILFAAVGGMVGFLLLAHLPRMRGAAVDRRFTEDRFGVQVTCDTDHLAAIRTHLEQAGAAEIRSDA